MARTALTVSAVSRGGLVAPAAQAGDAANGNSLPNGNGNVLLEVKNTDTASHTVTFHFAETVDGQPVTPHAVAVAAGATVYFGFFPVGEYGSSVAIDVDSALLTLQPLLLG